MLIHGADPNSVFGPQGSTPLHQAASGGRAGIVSSLLKWGANKGAMDRDGGTALLWAAIDSSLATVETLLTAGADTSVRSDGYSALDNAAAIGHIPVIKGHP